MILTMLLFGCLPETPAIWTNGFAGSRAVCSFIGRQALESSHFRFLRSTAILGLARWLYPIDLSQLVNSATMMWTYLIRVTSVVEYPAKWTNCLSPRKAIELSVFASLARLTKWMVHLWTARSYIGLQTPHAGPNLGLLFIGIAAVISVRSGSAMNRFSQIENQLRSDPRAVPACHNEVRIYGPSKFFEE